MTYSRRAAQSGNDALAAMKALRQQHYPRNDYAAAKPSRFRRQRLGLGGTGDAHYRSESEFMRVREYARDMVMNDSTVGSLVDRAVVNIMQTGFKYRPATGDLGLDTELELAMDAWMDDRKQCDADWEYTFWQQCFQELRSTFIDGDMFNLLLDDGSIQTIEADRCQSPQTTRLNVVHGVLLDGRRKVQYWFTKDPGMERARLVRDIDKYDTYDADGNRVVLQLYNPYTVRRCTQSRGVTAFAPVFDRLGMYEDVQFAKLVQQQIVSAIAYFIERDANYRGGSTHLGPTDPGDDSNTSDLERISAGLVVRGKPGEKLTVPPTGVPNPEFFPHVKLILQEIGNAIGMPLVLALMDASETNFSGWRGAVDAARKNESIFRHKWQPPSWPYMEPLKDAQADTLRGDGLLASCQQIRQERGNDFFEIVDENVEGWGYAIRAAKREAAALNAEFPDDAPVHWRELLNFGVSDPLKQHLLELAGEDAVETNA